MDLQDLSVLRCSLFYEFLRASRIFTTLLALVLYLLVFFSIFSLQQMHLLTSFCIPFPLDYIFHSSTCSGLYMVAAERQMQNREKRMMEAMRAAESGTQEE